MKQFNKENGIIYIAINIINNKKYIGQTITSLENRISKHKRAALNGKSSLYFHNAIRKYGFNNFVWEIKESNIINQNILDEKEIYWIKELKTHNKKYGYNMTDGGKTQRGLRHTEESKQKIRNANKGKSNLVHYINLYGKEKGTEVYNEYINKLKERKGKKRIDLLIEKYGMEEGTKKYNDMVNKIKEMRKRKGATNTKEVLGEEKYEEFSKKMKNKKDTKETKKLKSEAKLEYWKNKELLNAS